MRNIFLFITKNHNFFLFLLLETIALYLVFKSNYYHNAIWISSSNAISGNIYKIHDNIISYFSLNETNRKLAAENATLRNQMAWMHAKQPAHNKEEFPEHGKNYSYVHAKAIRSSVNKQNNYLTLDKGALHGIKPEMGVICDQGIVGIVKNVSDNFSTVISFLNKNAVISCKLKKSGYFGSLRWEGGKPNIATLSDVPRHARIAHGDTVITSGESAIFPEGILAGTIEDFNITEGDNFYTIHVKLSTDFARISYVYVIKNPLRNEQVELEKQTEDEH